MKLVMKLIGWFGIALAAVITSAGAFSQPSMAEYQAASALMLKASGGDKDAIGPAVEAFKKLSDAEPTNAVYLVNLGAVTSMQARTTLNPLKKISYAEDGMSMQDKALALLQPSNSGLAFDGVETGLRVKFVAASTFLAVPGFFRRGDQGARLLDEVLKAPGFAGSPVAFKGAVWLKAADHAVDQKRPNEARDYANKIVEANAPQVAAARAVLSK